VIRVLAAAAFLCGSLVSTSAWLLWPERYEQRSAAELMDVVMWGKEPVGGSFSLIDHDGRPRTDADFRGKMLLVYFGFIYCSDICPIDLQAISGALDRLGPLAENVQPLFITVDPEKDTPEQLKTHVALFHPKLIGLTGSLSQIRKVASDFKVYFEKSQPRIREDRGIDHSGFTFLLDRENQYLGFFPPASSPDQIATVLRPHLNALEER
jgi:cytochrome oxidase Cu insertion factor (SCO1/SenC/PrrC family)